MPRRYELTWDKTNKRWKKYHQGKQYYFPFGSSKTDMEGYRKALDAWNDQKAELDANAPVDPLVEAHRDKWTEHLDRLMEGMKRLEENDSFTNRDSWQQALAAVELTRRKIVEGVAHPTLKPVPGQKTNPVANLEPSGPAPWETMGKADTLDNLDETTVGGNVKRFLHRKRGQVERGERSHGRYESLNYCLDDFVKFAGGNKPIEALNGKLLHGYRDKLEARINQGDFSPHYAKNHIDAVKQFVRWAWEQELIELPRVLNSREFTIAIPENQVEVFTPDELKVVFANVQESTKLHLLLMLNCGMTQGDIADLKQSEVDWKAGRIERKRSKTSKHDNVPVVSYKLWPLTFQLLKKYRSKCSDLALTNRNGTALKSEEIVNGKVKKSDNIRSAYDRVLRKLAKREDNPINIGKPLKLFRKTAATMLGGHDEFGKYAQHFLGHSPRSIADKHYIRPSEEQFDRAVGWLETQFRIVVNPTPS